MYKRQLQYCAGDYADFGGQKKSDFDKYIAQLREWCASPYGCKKVRAVLAYVERGSVAADLVGQRVLVTGDDGKLVTDWKNYAGEAPQISKQLSDETECFVRWRVEDVYKRQNLHCRGQKQDKQYLNPRKWKNAVLSFHAS